MTLSGPLGGRPNHRLSGTPFATPFAEPTHARQQQDSDTLPTPPSHRIVYGRPIGSILSQCAQGRPVDRPDALVRTYHEYLLRRQILSPDGAVLVRPSRRTARTPPSALLARSPNGLRSRTPRDGIHEYSGLAPLSDRPGPENRSRLGACMTQARDAQALIPRVSPFPPVSRVSCKSLLIVHSHPSQAGVWPIVASHTALQAQPRADLSPRSAAD